MLALIGVFIVVIGFILKKDTIATVVIAGIVTGLVSNINIMEILEILGDTFVNQRLMTLFILTLPIIGICERYGLKQKSIDLIKKSKNITVGKINILYLAIRQLAAAFSLRLGGHAQFIRPLINPMAQGAAIAKYDEISEKDIELIKSATAAQDNYGNFFGQNLFLGSSGVLLIVGSLKDLGYIIDPLQVALASIPVGILVFIMALIQSIILDKKFAYKYGKSDSKSKNNI